jgi:hypothetical protein
MKNIIKKTILSLMVLGTTNAIADTGTYTFSFTTVPALTVAETQAIDFGQALALSNGSACTMLMDETSHFPASSVDYFSASNIANGTPGQFAASTCATSAAGTSGTYGIYTITGLLNSEIQVTVTGDAEVAANGIDFDADGYVVDYNNGGANTREAVNDGVAATLHLAGGADSTYTTPGTTHLLLGGTINNLRDLTLGEPLTAGFVVDVTYN